MIIVCFVHFNCDLFTQKIEFSKHGWEESTSLTTIHENNFVDQHIYSKNKNFDPNPHKIVGFPRMQKF